MLVGVEVDRLRQEGVDRDRTFDERAGDQQAGYRGALLTQLDLLIGELQEEGDFTADQIRRALEIRLEEGADALRLSRLAEDWLAAAE